MKTPLPAQPRQRAFTLVEMVVALTIVAILLTLAFPAMKALSETEEASHVTALLDLSRVMRSRAMSERRPYQIVFHQEAMYGLRYFYPYNEETTFEEFLAKQEEEIQRRKEEIKRMDVHRMQMAQDTPAATSPPLPNVDDEYFVRKIPLAENATMEVLPWGALEWSSLDGGAIHRWVFQPPGLCDPLRVRFGAEGQWHELGFEALTGELGTQRFYAQ